jgi:hypothetical protein
MTTFEDILSKPATQIDRPKPLPVGSYVWSIQGLPRFDKSKEKQTPFYEFQVKCVSALDDVDEEALKDWATKSDGSMRKLTEVTQKITFYITEDSLYRLQSFLVHCGAANDGETTAQAIDNSPNCQFVGAIVHTASKDGSSVYANIGKTAPVED